MDASPSDSVPVKLLDVRHRYGPWFGTSSRWHRYGPWFGTSSRWLATMRLTSLFLAFSVPLLALVLMVLDVVNEVCEADAP
jgi:hypothetical protein